MQNEPNFPHFSPKNNDLERNEPNFILRGKKMMQTQYSQRIMNKNPNFGFVKTKPIQNLSSIGAYLLFCRGTNNQSSLITNHLKGEPKISINTKGKTCLFQSVLLNAIMLEPLKLFFVTLLQKD